MLTSTESPSTAVLTETPPQASALSQELKELLERAYGVQFSIIDGQTGEVLYTAPGQPARDWEMRTEMCREVARHGLPEFIDDEDPLLALALPLIDALGNSKVAVVTFLSRHVEPDEGLSHVASLLGMSLAETTVWARSQTPWPTELLKRVSDLVLDHCQRQSTSARTPAGS